MRIRKGGGRDNRPGWVGALGKPIYRFSKECVFQAVTRSPCNYCRPCAIIHIEICVGVGVELIELLLLTERKGKSMLKIIGVTELQRRFRSVFDEVVEQQTPVVLTRGSRPEAVLISYQEYQRLQAAQAEEVLTQFDRVWARLARAERQRRRSGTCRRY